MTEILFNDLGLYLMAVLMFVFVFFIQPISTLLMARSIIKIRRMLEDDIDQKVVLSASNKNVKKTKWN